VTAVGPGVTRFKPGDEVLGVAPYSLASHALTADYALVHKPSDVDFRQASTIPITFLTAYYALVRLGQLQKGERLLIHAGAGGVGLAAIQIAQHLGAEVFATAGSDEKRDYLRSLGVKHVFSSRTLDFADEIMEVTERQGVDVVLNSLPREPVGPSRLRAIPRDRQDRHLPEPQDRPPSVPGQPFVLRDRPRPHAPATSRGRAVAVCGGDGPLRPRHLSAAAVH
jgi:D-arabinose 1-dehydrogenase-like Zn-dependent alcohol dehydrogenase